VPPTVIVSSITAPPGSTTYPDDGFALSPDGSMLVFTAGPEGSKRSLWLRRLDEDKSVPIPGTGGGFYPFWSPDSRQVGFFADGKLKRVDARGGPTQVLAVAPDGRGGTWGASGFIVYAPKFNGVLERLPAAGGDPEPITELDVKRGESSHRWPWLLPDDRHVLFLSQTAEGGSADDQSRIELLDLETRERRALFLANSSVAYSETGHILFWNQGALYARPFDAGSLELEGDLFPVVSHVLYTQNEMAGFTVDRKGTLIYQSGVGVTGLSRISWMSRTGDDLGAITGEGIVLSPRLSHDGTRMAYVDGGDIWVHDLRRGTSTRLSFGGQDDFSPSWSPDDQWVAYASSPGKQGTIFRKQASGLGSEEVVFKTEKGNTYASDWSPDGRSLMVGINNPDTAWDLWSVPLDGGEPAVLVQTPFMEIDGRYSPDGGWMAYDSTESGRDEIYVVRLAEGGGRWQISTGGGTFPTWRADGKEIFFVASDGVIMAADITLGEEFQAGIPREIFQAPLRRGVFFPYAPAADGQKFAVDLTKETTGSLPLTLVQNWTATVSGR
ncbi:MAG TPA: hypothetical protein VNI57_14595, partial [Candidatus Saccharimonadales bacterium]|nr:hypothetical protein [Candidatus Saccharimonadales bacterium]